jgi:glycine/D-amino acid oxidase-like deaminating enzyme/nitrite reductase/ring-hydroxylating ferredoxin subunit
LSGYALSDMDRSWWMKSSKMDAVFPTLEQAEADVAVIGAGITGVCCARLLLDKGYKVALIEARKIGAGTTGNSTAKLTSLAGARYLAIEKRHSADVARSYAELAESGIDLVEKFTNRFAIDCMFERCPDYVYSTESSLEDEAAAAKRAGLNATLENEIDLPFNITGAIKLGSQARFNPYSFCVGLASSVERDGGMVYENSRVTDVKGDMITTENAALRARHIIVTTQLPILDRTGHFSILKPNKSHCIAVSLQDAAAIPAGMYISADSPVRSIQSQGAILIIVGESASLGEESAKHYAALEDFARKNWLVKEVLARWSAHDYSSPDYLPYIGKTADKLYIATGFSKWGLAVGAASAMLISHSIEGTSMASFDAKRLSHDMVESFAGMQVKAAKHLIVDRMQQVGSCDGLEPGEGGLCRHERKTKAAYNDGKEKIHLSPSCQHLGCRVHWNQADKIWECPCHGSTYEYDGKVRSGPTVKPLPEE